MEPWLAEPNQTVQIHASSPLKDMVLTNRDNEQSFINKGGTASNSPFTQSV